MKTNDLGRCAALILMVLIGIAAYARNLSTKPDLIVEITVSDSAVRKNQAFPVHTIIRNAGQREQSLQVWSCSYAEQWLTDNPAIQIIGDSCNKNDVIRVTLKPGEGYKRDLSIRVVFPAEPRARKSVSFCLGFEPAVSEKAGTASPIWSKAITVSMECSVSSRGPKARSLR